MTIHERPGVDFDQLEIESAIKDVIVRILNGDVNGIYFDPDEQPEFKKKLDNLVDSLTNIPADLRRPADDSNSVATIVEAIIHLLYMSLESHLRSPT